MNSLWPTEQCRQGKSANQIRNFGKRIGSKGWVGRAEVQSGCRDLTGLGERLPPRGGRRELGPVSGPYPWTAAAARASRLASAGVEQPT